MITIKIDIVFIYISNQCKIDVRKVYNYGKILKLDFIINRSVHMTDILDLLVLDNLTILRFVFSMVLAIVLGLGIAYIYKLTHKGLNYESSFLSTLALLSPIVTLVMLFIQGNLVLSLGLVGSLSIIRFRTPIKDTRDMVFLFWTIATGLGIGTMNWTLSIMATLILGILMLIFYKLRYGKKVHNEYILIVSGHGEFNDKIIEGMNLNNVMKIYLRSRELENNNFEVVYELVFDEKNIDKVHNIISDLKKLEVIEKVSLLSPQLNLPM